MNDTTETKGLAAAVLVFTAIGLAVLLLGMVLFAKLGGEMVDRLDEQLGEVLMNRGIRLEEAGQYANAREAYSRALQQDFYGPQNRAMTCKRLGTLYWSAGQYDAAFTYLAKAAEFEPPIVSSFEPLADSYVQLMRYDEASRVIERWIRVGENLNLDRELARAWYMRGRVALLTGNATGATEAFEKSLNYGGDNRSACELARIQYEAGDYEGALQYIDRYLQSGGGPRSEELRDLRKHAEWKQDGLK